MKKILCIALTVLAVTPCLAEDMERQTATGGCMLYVKQVLHDPDSADFGHSSEASVIIKGNRAMVIRTARANNGFGAKRLSQFMCLLEQHGESVIPILIAEESDTKGVAKARRILKKWKFPID